MNHPDCILTGATFFDPVEQRHVRGDLHRIGDCYIMNCNTSEGGNTAWSYGEAPRTVEVVSAIQGVYFERRGVIVFTKEVAVFNDHAEQYLKPNRLLHREITHPDERAPWPFPTSSR